MVLVDVDLGRRGHSKALALIQGPLSAGARQRVTLRRGHTSGHDPIQGLLDAMVKLGDFAGTWGSV